MRYHIYGDLFKKNRKGVLVNCTIKNNRIWSTDDFEEAQEVWKNLLKTTIRCSIKNYDYIKLEFLDNEDDSNCIVKEFGSWNNE